MYKRIGYGNEGLIFQENPNEIIKIYRISLTLPSNKINEVALLYGKENLDELMDDNYTLLDDAKNCGLKVPKPLSTVKIPLKELYERCGKQDVYTERFNELAEKNPESAEKIKDHIVYGLRKEYIKGKSLGRNFLPSLRLKRMVQKIYSEFYDQGFIITDERPSNLVLTENDELYMIDEGSFLRKENYTYKPKQETFGFHTYFSDKGLLGYYMLEAYLKYKIDQKRERQNQKQKIQNQK